MSLIPLVAAPVFLHLGFAFADNGGLDGGTTDDSNTKGKTNTQNPTTVATIKTDTHTATATETATTATANTNTNTGTKSSTSFATAGSTSQIGSYNQWGFTGSQSVWLETGKPLSSGASTLNSASSSASLSSATSGRSQSSNNKTSNANRLTTRASQKGWKLAAFMGAIFAVTVGLHCL